MVGWPKLGEAAVGTGLRMCRWAGLRGGSLGPALSEFGGGVRGTASLVSPSELPAAGFELRPAWVRAGPAVEAGGPLGIRVQSERPSGTNILWAVERLAE